MWYTTWFGTPYYKLLYGHRDENEARAWVMAIIGKLGLTSGQRVLDMACGRGRHCGWFVNEGLRTTGIDLCAESIDEARAHCPNAEFHVCDMRHALESNAFDAVVCLFTSLGYSNDRADDEKAVRAAAADLRSGGHFVLDLMNSERLVRELVAEEEVEAQGVHFHISRAIEGDAVVKRIHVTHGENDLRFVERVHAFTPVEATAMVERAGLRIFDRTDGPPFPAFDPATSERLVIWAVKP
jgi:SAM-dependent methyltransferase